MQIRSFDACRDGTPLQWEQDTCYSMHPWNRSVRIAIYLVFVLFTLAVTYIKQS